MAVPESFLDELIARTDIVSLISQYVNLTKRGSRYVGLCPFHSEKTASFSVSPDVQLYHCFGCKASGGAIQFAMAIENLDFHNAVGLLAEKAGMSVPSEGENDGYRHRRERIYDVNKAAALFYHKNLDTAGVARDYLAARGISSGAIVRFGLGYAPQSWDALQNALTQQGFSKTELLDARLLVETDKGRLYDRFRNRIMFPIVDTRKRVLGFGGRVLDDSQPKYLNSPDTPVFSKGQNLYALNMAKNTSARYFILAEGYMDVIALHQAGFDSAVASLGTAFTDRQARLLARYTKELVLAFDSDEAGKKATGNASAQLEPVGVSVKVLRLSGAKDPDEFIRKFGAEALRERIEGAEDETAFRLVSIASRYDLTDDGGRVRFLKEAVQALARIGNTLEREIYAAKTADMAGLSPETVKLEVKRLREKLYKKALESSRLPEKRQRGAGVQMPGAEEGLLRLLLKDGSLLETVKSRLRPEDFSSGQLASLYAGMLRRWEQGADLTAAALIKELNPEEAGRLAGILQHPGAISESPKALEDYVRAMERASEARKSAADGEDVLLAGQLLAIAEKKGYGGQ